MVSLSDTKSVLQQTRNTLKHKKRVSEGGMVSSQKVYKSKNLHNNM